MRYALYLFTVLLVVSCESNPVKNQPLKNDPVIHDTPIDSTHTDQPLVLDSIVDDEQEMVADDLDMTAEEDSVQMLCLRPDPIIADADYPYDVPSGFVIVSYRYNPDGTTCDLRLEKSLHKTLDSIAWSCVDGVICGEIPYRLLKERFLDTIRFKNPRETVKTKEIPINIYPNPFKDHITVATENAVAMQYIDVFDIQGTLLKRLEPNSETARIETSDFKPGTYFLKVIDERNKVVKVQTMIKA